jgi:hypothetical protein
LHSRAARNDDFLAASYSAQPAALKSACLDACRKRVARRLHSTDPRAAASQTF